jgi:hypothetical protein
MKKILLNLIGGLGSLSLAGAVLLLAMHGEWRWAIGLSPVVIGLGTFGMRYGFGGSARSALTPALIVTAACAVWVILVWGKLP